MVDTENPKFAEECVVSFLLWELGEDIKASGVVFEPEQADDGSSTRLFAQLER